MKPPPRDLAASVRARLANAARQRGEDFNYVLTQYGVERLLDRLARSAHADRFLLKGAALFAAWGGPAHRATQDVDLLAHGDPDGAAVARVFAEVCRQPVEPDGLEFDADSLRIEPTRPDDEYDGWRLKVPARLGAARLVVQVDLGFGDAVTPGPTRVDYPTLLAGTPLRLAAYPPETVVAEKLHAVVRLGMFNSRMKDFFDLWAIAGRWEFEGEVLGTALAATFARRRTPLPTERPNALTEAFSLAPEKRRQWGAFLARNRVTPADLSLAEVVEAVWGFVGPPTLATGASAPFAQRWRPDEGWKRRQEAGDQEKQSIN